MKVIKPIIERPTETHYLLIVDSSTSMSGLTKTTINGINEQIDMVKDLEKEFPDQKYFMSFIHFNSKVVTEYSSKKPSELNHINESNYTCSGMTALMDAIGEGVTDLSKQISNKIETGEATAVVVIITDGEENSSRTFNLIKIKSLIEELQLTDKWTFTFIGANIDSMSTARAYGIATNNVMQFSGDVNSNSQVYASVTKSFKSRASKLSSINFSSENLNDFVDKDDRDLTSKLNK